MAKHPAAKELIENAEKAEDYKKALKVVAEMRRYQKSFFANKRQADLIEAKRLETAVDLRLAELGIRAV